MNRHLGSTVAALILVALWTTPCFATETPRSLWVKAKCALCHGEDGRGDTQSGRQVKVRDLRLEGTQKKSDEDLSKAVRGGHNKMPSFKTRLTKEEVSTLVFRIRDFAKEK